MNKKGEKYSLTSTKNRNWSEQKFHKGEYGEVSGRTKTGGHTDEQKGEKIFSDINQKSKLVRTEIQGVGDERAYKR
ncbi:hypothetical protein JTE90_021294 [Oedothorax gibbosus]|uniref:General stress protein n=1 Tax=Oedothorax gibbosus TaxID=931172 RepID=A0AAV6VMV6_9ARAC|nr:hypothetical protein JTE90_021294 [Oedothorax gibbosus]